MSRKRALLVEVVVMDGLVVLVDTWKHPTDDRGDIG